MKEKNRTNRNLKGQGSTEYILMLAGAIIVAIVILVFVFKVGGTAAKSGGLQAQLLGAEIPASSLNSLGIATNIQLPPYSSNLIVNGVSLNGGSSSGNTITLNQYQVSGGYESLITFEGVNSISANSISSITYTDTAGSTVVILPASGTNVSVVPDGSFPFTISQIT
ncbi:MAG: hypothetical protein QXU98_09860 [Candidatus Parvarchaeota archaeon]